MDHVIGIDIGTSAVKVIVVDAAEHVVASAEAPLETSRPRPGWAEQDPAAWWETTAGLLDALARDHAPAMARVGAIGLSGQSHATVLLDASDRPLRPAILWNDGRASAEAREIGERYPDLPRKVGVLCMPSFTAPKILWLARHDPESRGGDADAAAAEGLCRSAPDGRARYRHVGRRRHVVARRGAAPLVPGGAGGEPHAGGGAAEAGGGIREDGNAAPRACPALGPAGRRRRRGRRGRRGLRGDRHRRRAGRRRLLCRSVRRRSSSSPSTRTAPRRRRPCTPSPTACPGAGT